MLHGLHLATPFAVEVRPKIGFKCFVLCPDSSVEYLKTFS
jgi:hypothetical protein